MSSIAVIFGGLSPEHDISILTGLQAVRLLERGGADVVPLYWSRSGAWLRVPAGLEGTDFAGPDLKGASTVSLQVPDGFSERRRLKDSPLDIDVVVNCCHGGPGEDGTLTALLALCGLKVTGPTPDAAAWAMDKLSTAALVPLAQLERFKVEAIPTVAVTDDLEHVPFPAPWVLKPRFAGSSLGVEVGIDDLDTAKALARTGVARSGAVLQPYLEGWSDLNVAVRTFPELQVSAIERPLGSGRMYGYAEKYLAGADGMESARRELPAQLDPAVEAAIHDATRALATVLRLTGTPRVDYLHGDGRLALCEINAIPGSLALYLWAASGVDRTKLLLDLVQEARRSAPPAHWSASTDGAALRAAKTVAAKLR